MRNGLFLTTALASLLHASACTLICDLDRFETRAGSADAGTDAAAPDDTSCANPHTFCMRIERFDGPHSHHLVVADLVTAERNLRSRAMLNPYGSGASAELVMPFAIDEPPAAGEPHPLQVELWADATGDRQYTPTLGGARQDHEWRLTLPASGTLEFGHDTNFKSLDPQPTAIGGEFSLRLRGFGAVHPGRQLEVFVIEQQTGRTVGFYRLLSIPDDSSLELVIPGIIESFAPYRVEYWADADGDGVYSGLGPDHSWVIELVEAEEDGLSLDAEHSEKQAELTYYVPFSP